MPPLDSLQNDIRAMTAVIPNMDNRKTGLSIIHVPNWWHVTTQICVVLLIGHVAREISFNQSEALPISG